MQVPGLSELRAYETTILCHNADTPYQLTDKEKEELGAYLKSAVESQQGRDAIVNVLSGYLVYN